MQIELITNVAKSERFAPNWVDRAWIIMENAGSGLTGLLTSRQGDAACLMMVGTTTYTDRNAATASVGFEAIECDTTNAPPELLVGAWHDVVDVGSRGRIQCHGWDDDTNVLVGTAATDNGLAGIGVSGLPTVTPTAAVDANSAQSGFMCTIVELAALMTDATVGNHACYWRS